MTVEHDYGDLHELIDRLEPDQAEELREHALKLVRPASGRFKVLRVFSDPSTDLGARRLAAALGTLHLSTRGAGTAL